MRRRKKDTEILVKKYLFCLPSKIVVDKKPKNKY